MTNTAKRGRGRPPISGDAPLAAPFNVRLNMQQMEALDHMIERHPRIGDRNSMMRALFDFGVEQMEAEIKLLTKGKR